MIVKTYYQGGRIDAFDTANLTNASMYCETVVTNWLLDLSGAMLVGDEADDIDAEAEVCRIMGFDPATYALVEGLATDDTDNESEELRF